MTNTLVPSACVHLIHIYGCPESQRAGGPPGAQSLEGRLAGTAHPLKLRNERWQWGKHQVTALKGLSHEIATHNVTFGPPTTQECFAQWAGGSEPQLLFSWDFALL